MIIECKKCYLWDLAAKESGYRSAMCQKCFDKNFKSVHLPNQPDSSKREDSYVYSEFGTSLAVSFITSEGIKTIVPGKRYDINLNEI